MNGNKENSRIVKTYVCKCGEINRFSFETDFNFMEVRIDAHCQGCGKDISISVEKHFGNGNDSSYPQNGYQNNNYSNGYSNEYSQPSYPAPSYPSPSSILEPQSPASSPSEPQSSPSSGMMDFNFDALTSAAESMSSTPAPAPEPTTAVQDYTNYASPTAPQTEVAETLNSLTPDIMQDAGSEVPEISEPAPLPLATTVIQTPAKKIIQEVEKEEEKDLLSCSNEVEEMNKDVTPDDQEAFIDLFGRL